MRQVFLWSIFLLISVGAWAASGVQEEPASILERARWYRHRHALDEAHAAEKNLLRARWAYEAMSPSASGKTEVSWSSLGPVNGAGRCTAVALHPSLPGTVLIGAAGGGLWKTDDNGATWNVLTDGLPDLSVGAVAYASSDPQIIYLGTGEGSYAGDAIPGIGLLRSDDGGASWQLPETVVGTRVFSISVDPREADSLLIGTEAGVLRSTDGGMSWQPVITDPDLWGATAVVRSPDDPERLWTTLWCSSPCPAGLAPVMRSLDGGLSWIPSDAGLPDPAPWMLQSRRALAVAPSDGNVLYLALNTGSSGADGLPEAEIYRSENGGDDWSLTAPTGPYLGRQGWYDNALAVHATNPMVVVGAGVGYVVTTDGGSTWTSIDPYLLEVPLGDDAVPHVDGQAVGFQGDRAWLTTDGGVWTSDDLGATWQPRNFGLVTRQYYSLSLDPSREAVVLGGTQDNGSDLRREADDDTWTDVLDDDGVECAIHPLLPWVMYGSEQFGQLFRSFDRGLTWVEVSAPRLWGDLPSFFTPFELDPASPGRILTGTNRVWASEDGGQHWQAMHRWADGAGWPSRGITSISAASDLSGAMAVAISDRVFVGDGQHAWFGSVMPASVNHVEISPHDSAVMFASLVRASSDSPGLMRSTDGGMSWQRADHDLPPFSVQVCRVDPLDPTVVWAGTDVGLYQSSDGGLAWNLAGEGLPAASAHDVAVAPDGRRVVVASHGRGMWQLTTEQPANEPPTVQLSVHSPAEPVQRGDLFDVSVTVNDPDGDATELWLTQTDSWSTERHSSDSGALSLVWTLRAGSAGTLVAGAKVSDAAGGVGFDAVNVEIAEPAESCGAQHAPTRLGASWFTTVHDNNATTSDSDPSPVCAPMGSGPDWGREASFWFHFEAPENARYNVVASTIGAEPVVSFWTGPPCGPYEAVPAACSGTAVAGSWNRDELQTELSVDLNRGTTYRIMVGTAMGGWSHPLRLQIQTTDDLGSEHQVLIPAAAHAAGIGNTDWRTDVQLVNSSGSQTSAVIRTVPESGSPVSKSFELASRSALLISDALHFIDPLASHGALLVTAEEPLIVSSRTYTTAGSSSFGQGIPAVDLAELAAPGSGDWICGLSTTGDLRVNLGAAMIGEGEGKVLVEVVDQRARVQDVAEIIAHAPGWVQHNEFLRRRGVADVDFAYNLEAPTLRITNASVTAIAATYASAVDNTTGDPSYLAPAAGIGAGESAWIVAAASAWGVNSSHWTTDLWMVGQGPGDAAATLRYLPAAGSSTATHTVKLWGGQAVRLHDVVHEVFGRQGAGAIEITVNEGIVRAVSRTATTAPGGGSYGQTIPAISAHDSLTPGQWAVLPMLEQSADFRTNIGLLNSSEIDCQVVLVARDDSGAEIGRHTHTVAARSWLQLNQVLPAGVTWAEVGTDTESAAIFAYASVVDNASNDPTFHAAISR